MITPSFVYDNLDRSSASPKSFRTMMKLSNRLKEQGIEVTDCSIGEPTHGLLESVKKVGIKAIKEDKYFYVKPTRGLSELRNKIAEQLSLELNKNVDSDQVVVTPGAELGLDLIMKALINEGDEVIIFDPFFIPFVSFVESYKGRPIILDTYNTNFLPDVAKVSENITSKTKMIILNSPSNPTGRVYSEEIVRSICSVAKENNILVLSDEAYNFFDYDHLFNSPYSVYPEGTIVVRSFSKKFCMMGYKVGYIVANKQIINWIESLQFPGWGAPMISSLMALEAIKNNIDANILLKYRETRDKLYENFKDLNLIGYKPEGSFYFYLNSSIDDALKYSFELAKKGLIVIPAFSKRNTHVRLSYGSLKSNQIDQVISIIRSIM